MAGTGDFKVAVKLHADASQYTAEFTKASQLAQTFAGTLQAGGSQAASGLQTATTASQALGAATVSSSQQASSSLTQVSTAAQSLGGHLQTTGTQATQASQGMDGLTKSSREATQSQQQSRAAGDALIAMLRDQIATTGKSSEELLRYRAAQSGVAAEAAPLILQWQNQKAAQLAAAEAARQEEAAQREAQAVKQRAAQTQEQFLAGLREQIALQGKSSTEVLQYRAAQLGVSAEAANSIRLIDDANKKGAISAGQHAQAMRMLPAQMTDVVTSVASGMPIWMVAIQQGGQIKDSFGGAGAAARAMLGAITPLAAGLAVGTAAIGLTAAAYYQGSAEADGFRKALVMTGNTAGVTVSQMSEISKAVGDVVGGQHSASQALTQLAGTGAIAGESLQQFTTVAMNLERYAGQPIKKTAEDLAKLGDEPVKASMQLNEQYHYLTESVYRQIKALEDQGRKDDAAALAQKTYSDAMAERAGTMKSNLGTLERAWESLGSMASKAWNAMLNVGRAATLDDIRTKIDNTNRDLNDLLSGDGFASNGGGAAFGAGARGRAARIEQLKKQLSDLNAQAAPLEAEDAQAQIKAQQRADEEVKLAARQRTDALAKEVRSRADIRKQEIEQLDRDRKTLDLSQKEYDKLLAGINSKYKDPKGNKGTGSISVTDTDLANMRSQLQAAQQYHQQLLTLGSGATELNSAERESLKIAEQLRLATDGKTIARLQEKQAIADTLAAQLRSNEGLEQSYKAHQQAIDANYKDAQSIGQRARDQAAANEVFGKGRTAIEQMTLATLEHQLAEAEGSDRFDPKYIASLREKIAAQKDWVAALGQADYKAVNAHADELLRNAKELSKTYEDELALSGLTGLERAKIVAQRAVELKYAKELAQLDRKSLTEDEKQAARKKMEEARDIESAAAVAKAQQDHMAKASEEINRSLTDALMRGFESGKGFAENFADTVKNLFNTMVLRPVISAVMAPTSGVINGVVQQGLNAVGLGGGSNVLGMAQNASSLYNMGSTAAGWLGMGGTAASGLVAMAGTGTTLAATGAGLGLTGGLGAGYGLAAGGSLGLSSAGLGASLGSGIGTSAAASGAVSGAAASGAGSLMSGLAAAGPWIAGAVALYSLISSLDNSGTPHTGAGSEYFAGRVSKAGNPGQDWSSQTQTLTDSLAGTLGASLDSFAKAFGKEAGYRVFTGFADDSSKDGAWGMLNIQDAMGKVLVDWEASRNNKWASKVFSDGEAGYKEYLQAIFADVQQAFLQMDLPAWSDQLLVAATDLDSLGAALQQIGTIKTVFDSLGQSMSMFSGISGELQTQLLTASGSVDALASNAGSFYEGFFSEAERMQILSGNLRDTLSGLNVSIDPAQGDSAKAQFRATVEAAFAAGNGELASQLLALSQSFKTAADYAGGLNAATKEQSLRAANKEQDLQIQLLRAQGNEIAAVTLERRRELAALADFGPAVQAMQTEIWATLDDKAAISSAKAALDAAISREREALQSQRSLVQESVAMFSDIASSAHDAARGLLGAVQSTAQMQFADAQAYIADIARSGGTPDADALRTAIEAVQRNNNATYTSALDYERDNLAIAAGLDSIGYAADDQLTISQRQLDRLDAQLGGLDTLAQLGREEIGAVLSVADAVAQLQGLLGGQRTAAAYSGAITAVSGSAHTAEEKAALYNAMRSAGLTDAQIRNQVNKTSGVQTEADWDYLRKVAGVPGFATGGDHLGGLRIVGERGWELEATGPSRIWNQQQLAQALSGSNSGGNSSARTDELLSALIGLVTQLLGKQGDTAIDNKRTREVLEAIARGEITVRTEGAAA